MNEPFIQKALLNTTDEKQYVNHAA